MSPAAIKGSAAYLERFWSYVEIDPLGCWIWIAGKSKGYGVFHSRGYTHVRAHVFSWEITHALSSPTNGHKLEFDHTCRNRACVNPNHLEVVTHKVNNHRGFSVAALNARKIACVYGHKLDDAILEGKINARRCRECESQRVANKQLRRHKFLRMGLTRDGNPRKKALRSNVKIMDC